MPRKWTKLDSPCECSECVEKVDPPSSPTLMTWASQLPQPLPEFNGLLPSPIIFDAEGNEHVREIGDPLTPVSRRPKQQSPIDPTGAYLFPQPEDRLIRSDSTEPSGVPQAPNHQRVRTQQTQQQLENERSRQAAQDQLNKQRRQLRELEQRTQLGIQQPSIDPQYLLHRPLHEEAYPNQQEFLSQQQRYQEQQQAFNRQQQLRHQQQSEESRRRPHAPAAPLHRPVFPLIQQHREPPAPRHYPGGQRSLPLLITAKPYGDRPLVAAPDPQEPRRPPPMGMFSTATGRVQTLPGKKLSIATSSASSSEPFVLRRRAVQPEISGAQSSEPYIPRNRRVVQPDGTEEEAQRLGEKRKGREEHVNWSGMGEAEAEIARSRRKRAPAAMQLDTPETVLREPVLRQPMMMQPTLGQPFGRKRGSGRARSEEDNDTETEKTDNEVRRPSQAENYEP